MRIVAIAYLASHAGVAEPLCFAVASFRLEDLADGGFAWEALEATDTPANIARMAAAAGGSLKTIVHDSSRSLRLPGAVLPETVLQALCDEQRAGKARIDRLAAG